MATSNDVKSAHVLKQALCEFDKRSSGKSSDEFFSDYHKLLNSMQAHLGEMQPTPVVSMAAQAVKDRHCGDPETLTSINAANETSGKMPGTTLVMPTPSGRSTDKLEYS